MKHLAEFIEMEKTEYGWKDPQGVLPPIVAIQEGFNVYDNLLFDQSLDWLQPVLDQIIELGHQVVIGHIENRCYQCKIEIIEDGKRTRMFIKNSTYLHTAIYDCVDECVEALAASPQDVAAS